MRQRFEGTDFKALNRGLEDDIAKVITAAVAEETGQLQADFRDQIKNAGLGERLARTVRRKDYPDGMVSLDPAGWVWTKAPKIIDAYARGAVIRPTDGRFYLAIPTRKVPRKGRRPMTPVEVEAEFNQDLIIRKGRAGRWLAYVDVSVRRFQRSQGRAYGSKGRALTKRPKPQLVLMFTLTRQVKVKKAIDLEAIARASDARFPNTLSRHWAQIPDRTVPTRRF